MFYFGVVCKIPKNVCALRFIYFQKLCYGGCVSKVKSRTAVKAHVAVCTMSSNLFVQSLFHKALINTTTASEMFKLMDIPPRSAKEINIESYEL